MKTHPTIYDVARLAEVTPTMASRILRGIRQRRDEATERVHQAALTLGFQTNQVASSLRQQDSRLIALVVPSLKSPFFAAYTETLTQVSYQHGYVVISLVLTQPADLLPAIKLIRGYRIQYVVSAVPELAQMLGSMSWNGTLVAFARDPNAPVSYVGMDDMLAGALVRQHLIQLGHTRWLIVAESPEVPSTGPRITGLTTDLPDNYHVLVRYLDDLNQLNSTAVEQWIASLRPTAIVGTSDAIALRLYSILAHQGYQVPEELSLVSIDGTDATSQMVPVSLTTVVQPIEECAHAVIQSFQQNEVQRVIFTPILRVGESTSIAIPK